MEEQNIEEQPLIRRDNRYKWTHKTMNVFIFLVVILIIFVGFLVSLNNESTNYHKKNVILFISDGFGPTTNTFGRTMYQKYNNLSIDTPSPLDKLLVGQIKTYSLDSLITDSAAGATAFSCSLKTYNGATGVDGKKIPCGTVLEAAKDKDYLTGLVVTSRITHATPAAFSAHVENRWMEEKIAEQQLGFYSLGRKVDIMFGGGKCFFMPKSQKGACRKDEKNLLKIGKKKGWNFVFDKKEIEFNNLENQKLPLAGLFSNSVKFYWFKHMSYEIDRSKKELSLKQMTEAALNILNKESQNKHNGFFLMIEGSRIDMAAHKF